MFEDILGPFQGGFLTPEMGRLLATTPEALIPHFAAAGVEPPSDSGALPLAAQPTGYQAPSGTGEFDPLSGLPAQGAGDWRPNWLTQGVNAIKQYGAGGAAPAAAAPSIPQMAGASPFNTFGGLSDILPLATGGGAPAPSGAAGPMSSGIPLPTPRPAAAGGTDMSADSQKGTLASALSGVKMPPQPEAQRITSPHVPSAPGMPTGSPLAAALARYLQGGAPPDLRLAQALGRGG